MAGLEHGRDLGEAILALAAANDISCAWVNAIGAVSCARISAYRQAERRYLELELKEPLELVSCLGNISLRDKKPFLHAHVVLGREDGSLSGGHLCPGTPVFAGECCLFELAGGVPERIFDSVTGLGLWPRRKPGGE